jgi:predicted Zn finger-like uncharacterized protein
MKFLCPSCKAKYQIGDDKVAGRSVRMKCRKCGYLISISKAVTEGSVSKKLSAVPPPPDAPPAPPPSAARRAAALASKPVAPPPRPPPRQNRPLAKSPLAPPARPAPRGGAVAAQPYAHHEPEPVPEPASRKNGNGASTHGAFTPGSTLVQHDDDERTVIAGIGTLAHTFAESVVGPDSSALVSSLASTDEWYVGINGVPVGPIRLSELRSKASVGAINTESLVWREGFEQWIPLANFPELVAIVEEGLSSARASLTPLSPAASPAVPPAAPRPEVYDPFSQPGALSDPFGGAATTRSPFGPEPSEVSSPLPLVTPLGPPTGLNLVTEPRVEMEDFLPPRRRGTSPFAWVAVGVAMLFGLTIGFVMFSKKPPEPVVKYVEVPAKGNETAPATSGEPGSETAGEVETDAGLIRVASNQRPGNTKGSEPKAGDPAKPLSGLQGLQGLSGTGPSSGPGSGSTSSGGGGQPLDSGSIQKTVGKYTGSVRRSCWQPALDARAKDAPTGARVNVTIVVAPSGSVQSVSTSGDPKGYPGLSSCIASRVRAWQFPASSGTTTVNVPFVFAAQ